MVPKKGLFRGHFWQVLAKPTDSDNSQCLWGWQALSEFPVQFLKSLLFALISQKTVSPVSPIFGADEQARHLQSGVSPQNLGNRWCQPCLGNDITSARETA